MATLTLTPSTISHTLPAKFWGIGHSPYASNNDQPITAYKNLVLALNMEVFRAHSWGDGTDANQSQTLALKAMALDYGTTTILQLNADSVNVAQNPTGNYPNDIVAAGDGSASDMAATLASWIAAGIDVGWLEPYNEPYNNFVGGVGQNWKSVAAGYPGSSDNDKAGNACRDWSNIYQKQIYQGTSGSTPVAGCVIAGAARDYIYGEALRFLEPNVYIPSTPRSDTNYAFFDTYSCHAYFSAPSLQGALNAAFYTGAPDNTDASATSAFCNNFRTQLDSNGKSAADMIFTECANFNGGSDGAIFDAMYAVMFSRAQARWNVGCFIYHSIDTTNVDMVINDNNHTHATYQRTLRYRVMEQLVGPFCSGYKKQLFSDTSLSWSVAPGNTPASSSANAVPRLQVAAGLNPASTAIGVLIANIDLGTAESITLNLSPGYSMSGPATYTKMDGNVAYALPTDVASLATGNIAGTSNGSVTLTQSIAKEEAWLIVIPLTAPPAPVASGAPPPLAPPSGRGATW